VRIGAGYILFFQTLDSMPQSHSSETQSYLKMTATARGRDKAWAATHVAMPVRANGGLYARALASLDCGAGNMLTLGRKAEPETRWPYTAQKCGPKEGHQIE
jgi:hypothetical protein